MRVPGNKDLDNEPAELAAHGFVAIHAQLELVDQIGTHKKLIACSASVVAWTVPGVVETNLRTQHHGRAKVLRRIERILGVLCLDAGALALLIVQEIGSESDGEMRIDLVVDVVHDGILGRHTGDLARGAVGSVRANLSGSGIGYVSGYVRDLALIHEPCFRGHVPLGVELVIPGGVIVLEVVISVLAIVDAVGADIEVIVIACR